MLNAVRGKASERKMQLFACACCRLVWHLLPDLCHRIVEATEQYADQEIAPTVLAGLFNGFFPDRIAVSDLPGGNQAAEAVGHLGWNWRWAAYATDASAEYTSYRVARSAAEALAKSIPWQNARQLEAELFRDIFGPLTSRLAGLDIAWIAWNDGTIPKLAQGIYEDRAFDRLPVLGDALEDAGCTDAGILDHLRGAGPHALGCWALDLLTGRA
jgi:hypothetical protein